MCLCSWGSQHARMAPVVPLPRLGLSGTPLQMHVCYQERHRFGGCTQVLANTVNGTTYTGIRARTTGAPQNHWFGPSGDPRGAGIGTPEAIRLVWSAHREIIFD